MTKYQKSLRSYLIGRKESLLTEFKQALTRYERKVSSELSEVYAGNSIKVIIKKEKQVSALCKAILGNGFSGLEAIVKTPITQTIDKNDTRPVLTYSEYEKLRANMVSTEEIRKDYKLNSSRAIQGFAKHYNHLQRQRTENKKPLLTLELYELAKKEKLSNEEIKKKYRLPTPHSLGGFAKHSKL